jgi:hypothetical protein
MRKKSTMSEPGPTVSPGLKRGERRRWWLFAAAILLIGYLAFQFNSQAAISAKTDRALKDQTAIAQQARAAAMAAQHAIDCINSILGSRAALTAADNADHVAFADLIQLAVTQAPVKMSDHNAIQEALGLNFAVGKVPTSQQIVAGLKEYAIQLNAHQDTRNQIPLGAC